MSFITMTQARAKSRSRFTNRSMAHGALVASAQSAPAAHFDVFVSHSSLDIESIAGLKLFLEDEDLTVYVDSVVDPQLDREQVTIDTAKLLKKRMDSSRFLIYATSEASPQSRWMPWELGYFDGSKPDKVGIVPLVRSASAGFASQEYLSLYPAYEFIDFVDHGRRLGRWTGPRSGKRLVDDVRS